MTLERTLKPCKYSDLPPCKTVYLSKKVPLRGGGGDGRPAVGLFISSRLHSEFSHQILKTSVTEM